MTTQCSTASTSCPSPATRRGACCAGTTTSAAWPRQPGRAVGPAREILSRRALPGKVAFHFDRREAGGAARRARGLAAARLGAAAHAETLAQAFARVLPRRPERCGRRFCASAAVLGYF